MSIWLLLGVNEALLNAADCIAFDVHAAGPPGQGAGVLNGFESAQFFGTDTVNGIFSNAEAAAELGLRPTASNNRYIRALCRLKSVLSHHQDSPSEFR